jgi:hypothetical protein
LKRLASIALKIHLAHQVFGPGIVAERVHHRIDIQPVQPVTPLAVVLFDDFDGSIFVA